MCKSAIAIGAMGTVTRVVYENLLGVEISSGEDVLERRCCLEETCSPM